MAETTAKAVMITGSGRAKTKAVKMTMTRAVMVRVIMKSTKRITETRTKG